MSVPYGHCHCECGQKTGLAKRSDPKNGIAKGRPNKYLPQHHAKTVVHPEDAKPFKIAGVYCRLIALTQGQYAIVDEADYLWAMQWKWSARYSPHTKSFYAYRGFRRPDGVYTSIVLHRAIMGLDFGDEREVDHVDAHNTLDDRRANLRTASSGQNSQNKRRATNNKSGVKGVSWSKAKRRWIVQIQVNLKKVAVGEFTDFAAAVERSASVRSKLHGEFSRTA